MANYFLTHKAVKDLSDIWNYTYETWSESQADNYYELLIHAFQEIAQNPKLGKNYEELNKEVFGLRTGKHVIFYRLTTSDDIEILRILHQKIDLKKRMEE